MCGIVGIWRLDGSVDEQEVIAARDTLIARGPDDAGVHIEPGLGLGHRRLSIIDLSPAGRMPMANETGDIWAVFNGEIYNFRELRRELESKGHVFRSHTDSEVAIHAFEQWGTNCFERFDGMFALAIWDRRARRLVLARDITGEKPLFYCATNNRVVFGSTVRALLAFPEIRREVDSESLRLYVEFGYVPAPRCILRGANKLPPGSFAVFERDRDPVVEQYWKLETQAQEHRLPSSLSLDRAGDELLSLLRASVRSRLVADVPLGAFLSGGVDSSLIVALMAEVSTAAVRTFTIGFEDPEFDESGYAQRVAKHLGVKNTVLVMSAGDVLRELPEVTRALDEPMADYSVLPSLSVARLARQHVTVALTGDGADEAFGGYRYYGATRLFESVAALVPQMLRTQLAKWGELISDPRIARAVQRGTSNDAAAYFGRSGFYRGATANGSAARVLRRVESRLKPDEIVATYVRSLPFRPTEAGMLWDATHTLPDAWLTKVDRTTMAVGLEARAPFLDRRVLEYGFKLPLDLRVRGNQKKIVLRNVLSRYLPPELIDRPKQGFTAPLRKWFAGELRTELHDRMSHLDRFDIIDHAGVQSLLAEQLSGRADHTQLLWALFHLDCWHDEYFVFR